MYLDFCFLFCISEVVEKGIWFILLYGGIVFMFLSEKLVVFVKDIFFLIGCVGV